MIKTLLIILLSITFSGCWWIPTLSIGTGAALIEGKEKENDEIQDAVRHEKYRLENERRAKLGMPPIEEEDIPEYERKRNSILY